MNQNNQQFIKASVIIVIVAGLLGAIAVMSGGIGPANAKVIAISLAVIIFGITATICMVVTRKPEYKKLGIAGMIASGIAFLIVFIVVVAEIESEGLLKAGFAFFIASIGLAHICLLHNFNLQNKYALYARITATIGISLFSLLLITRVFEPLINFNALAYNQSILKILLASLVIDLSATLLVPLCNRLKTDVPVQQHTNISVLPAKDEEKAQGV
jgi:hypothetical protein